MLSKISDVSFRDLQVFVMAARTHSIREVARQLELLPAHTSKIIQGLEKKLDVQLFRRSVSGIIPTPEGLAVLEVAERICELSAEMGPESPRPNQASEKLWTFGSIGFLATYLLAPSVCAIQASSKKSLRFRLVEFTHNDLVAHGLKGAFELGLHIEELEWTHVWESYKVGYLRWNMYGRIDHPLENGCVESEVAKFPFIVPTDWGTHGYSIGEDFCPLSVRRRRKGNEAATAETALEICAQSHQLTFVPEVLAQKWCLSGQMKEIKVKDWPLQSKEIFLSVRSDLVPRSLVESLLRYLKEQPSVT